MSHITNMNAAPSAAEQTIDPEQARLRALAENIAAAAAGTYEFPDGRKQAGYVDEREGLLGDTTETRMLFDVDLGELEDRDELRGKRVTLISEVWHPARQHDQERAITRSAILWHENGRPLIMPLYLKNGAYQTEIRHVSDTFDDAAQNVPQDGDLAGALMHLAFGEKVVKSSVLPGVMAWNVVRELARDAVDSNVRIVNRQVAALNRHRLPSNYWEATAPGVNQPRRVVHKPSPSAHASSVSPTPMSPAPARQHHVINPGSDSRQHNAQTVVAGANTRAAGQPASRENGAPVWPTRRQEEQPRQLSEAELQILRFRNVARRALKALIGR